MAEEFQESEVMFIETAGDDEEIPSCDPGNLPSSCRESRNSKGMRRKSKAVNKKKSVPVSIPAKSPRSAWLRCDDGDDGEMVPPHVIVGRRVAGKMLAFSICTGNGRIVKGRDLSEFRNLILRMTGFLET